MKLYELSQNYRNLLNLIDNEDIPAEILQESIMQIEEEFSEKAENICKVMQTLQLEAKAIKEEEERLAKRRKNLENKAKTLKVYLEAHMKASNVDKIKGKVFTISISKNPPKVLTNDLSNIPERYLIPQDPKINRKAILQDLKDGLKIEGVELIQEKSIRIK